ncbi:MAG: type II toxin-antitoxin system VapB family antitoxin [Syntrophobacterales bacterium]|nr:type II toxin-antitoxin system VapB family antitoxin [Syntrophobacterales bacterium]
MRTTIVINEDLLDEVKTLSGAKSKRDAVEKALEEFVSRRKARRLMELEGKLDLAFTPEEFLERRKRDVPHR